MRGLGGVDRFEEVGGMEDVRGIDALVGYLENVGVLGGVINAASSFAPFFCTAMGVAR